jgi:hypothetical protein
MRAPHTVSPRLRNVILVALLVVTLAPPSWAQTTTHSITNGTMTVGIDSDWGGAIVYLNWNNNGNWINNGIPDPGRQVQVALYTQANYPNCWACDATCSWPWNPVEGGNACGSGSGVQTVSATGTSIYSRTQPLQWNPRVGVAGRSQTLVEQTLSFVASNVLQITYTITNNETFTIQGNNHESPVAYLDQSLSQAASYLGAQPWTGDFTTDITPPVGGSDTQYVATEDWVAWLIPGGVGLGLYVPHSPYNDFWQVHKLQPAGTTPTNAVQRWAAIPLGPGQQYTWQAYLVAGTLPDIRSTIYSLAGH